MRTYNLSVTLLASFDIDAESREEAERIARGICEGGAIIVTEDADNEESLSGRCDVEGEIEISYRATTSKG